jgi:hypothetical protein
MNVPAGMRKPPFCEADRADYITALRIHAAPGMARASLPL